MQPVGTRGRLLAGAALGLGFTVLPHQAQAACVVTPTAVTCGTTTTTNTTNAGASPAADRNYLVNTSTTDFTGTVATGAIVDGFGLAFTNTTGGAFNLNVVNNGAVQVNAGNTPAAGGNAALVVRAIGATSVNYSGTGNVINLGTAGGGLVFNMTGTGNLVAAVGGNVTSAVNFTGIFVNNTGTGGNTTLTTAAGTTIRADFVGIYARHTNVSNAGNISVTNNATIASLAGAPNTLDFGIAVEQFGTGSVAIANTGSIGTATDRTQSTGIFAAIYNGTSTAPLSVTGSGPIFSRGDGIFVSNRGSGTTTVNYTGAIDTTAGDGIQAIGTTGSLIVTSGAITALGGNGILTTTTTGNQTTTVSGNVTSDRDGVNATATTGTISVTTTGGADITGTDEGIDITSGGNRIVTVGAGSVVTGGDIGILSSGAGTTTITNAGTITGTNAAISAGAATNGAFNITNQTGGTITGRVDLTDANDTLANAGTLALSGAQNFRGGVDLLTNQTGGIITVAAGTTFLGLETLTNAGTITAGSGLTFDAGNTALNNTGTINAAGVLDFGLGADVFANTGTGILTLTGNTALVGLETFTQSGRINLATFTLTGTGAFVSSGTIDTSGSAGLAGFTSLSNSGTIDLAPGTFTVPAVVFTNSGTILADEGASTITGQTSFANSGTIDLQDALVGDVLTINSGFVGSGGSNLLIDFNSVASDRLVINGAASGSTTVNSNFLGGGLLNSGGVLVVDATTATGGVFVLGTVGGDTPLVDFALQRAGGDFFLVSTLNASAFNPLVIPGFANDLWYQSANEVFAETSKPATTAGFSLWGNGYYSQDRYGDDDDDITVDGVEYGVDYETKTKRRGIQIGVDYGLAGGGRVGLTGGYGWAKANGSGDADLKAKGWNLGVYGQFGGITGFHGEVLAKIDRYEGEFDDGLFDGTDFDIRSTGFDGSIGYRFGMGADGNLDVLAGLSHVRTKVDDISLFGFDYDIDRMTSTRGRAGVRAVFGGSLAPYVAGTVHHEFRGNGNITLFDGGDDFDLDTRGKGTWGRLEAGLNGNDGPGLILAAWGELGDRQGFGLRAGFRIGGAAIVAAPPPPPVVAPPPPPAPPATQTCPDGSVILATDSCPLPPPPPPPPAPEPERG